MPALVSKIPPIKRLRDWLASDDFFNGRVIGSSLAGFLGLVLIAATILFSALRDHRHDNARGQTLDILRVANKVENELNTLETGHRGFLLTGDIQYLQPVRVEEIGASLASGRAHDPRR